MYNFKKIFYSHRQPKAALSFAIYLAGALMVVPITPLLCRFIPPIMIGEYNIDLVVAFVLTVIAVRLLIWLVKPLLLPMFVLTIAFFAYTHISHKYTFRNMLTDYRDQVRQNWAIKEEKENDLLNANPHFFENIQSRTERLVKAKVNPKDSLVRNFSIQHSLDYFSEYKPKYGAVTRYLSLFKYINEHFNYVPDPKRDEYYASARETITNGLGGDCDDHSILMGSCMESIGAQCRLVVVRGHMYPELLVGDKEQFEIMQKAIVLLFADKNIDQIYYHENGGEYWINLDYTARYPGGPYMNDDVKLVINL